MTGEVTIPLLPCRSTEFYRMLGESKGDDRQAATILDLTLSRGDHDVPVTDLIEALVYRAELAIRLGEGELVDALLSQVRSTTLDDAGRASLGDARAKAAELERVRQADRIS